MDINSLNFDKSNKEEMAKSCFIAIKLAEPYPYELLDNRAYDGQEIFDGDRLLATMAKRWLEKNGYLDK